MEKDKDADLLGKLKADSWKEIDNLNAKIDSFSEDCKLSELLKNLLTSYYIFAGGLETLIDDKQASIDHDKCYEVEQEPDVSTDSANIDTDYVDSSYNVHEPFEYFVDFDDPVGEPLTDKDLYNN